MNDEEAVYFGHLPPAPYPPPSPGGKLITANMKNFSFPKYCVKFFSVKPGG